MNESERVYEWRMNESTNQAVNAHTSELKNENMNNA